jgi:hypothetical protein
MGHVGHVRLPVGRPGVRYLAPSKCGAAVRWPISLLHMCLPVGRPVAFSQPAAAACVHHRASSNACLAPSSVTMRPDSTRCTAVPSCSCTPEVTHRLRSAADAAAGWSGSRRPRQKSLLSETSSSSRQPAAHSRSSTWLAVEGRMMMMLVGPAAGGHDRRACCSKTSSSRSVSLRQCCRCSCRMGSHGKQASIVSSSQQQTPAAAAAEVPLWQIYTECFS